MALSVSTRALTWKFLSDPGSALLLTRLVREMGALTRAQGIALSDRAILPTARLCALPESEAVEIILRTAGEYRVNAPQHRMSALQDLLAGRPLEVNETLGYALARARELKLDVPMLECFTALITAIDHTQRA
jgi:ketopantoate reductase